MKKLMSLAFVVALFSAFTFACNADRNATITANQLPENAKQFISKHFPKNEIKFDQIEEDGDDYDVVLNNNVEISFDRKGDWEDIKACEPLPNSIVNMLPKSALEYIKANYANAQIIEMDNGNRTWDNWDVKLKAENSTKIELEFNKNGKLLDVDYD